MKPHQRALQVPLPVLWARPWSRKAGTIKPETASLTVAAPPAGPAGTFSPGGGGVLAGACAFEPPWSVHRPSRACLVQEAVGGLALPGRTETEPFAGLGRGCRAAQP